MSARCDGCKRTSCLYLIYQDPRRSLAHDGSCRIRTFANKRAERTTPISLITLVTGRTGAMTSVGRADEDVHPRRGTIRM